MPDRQALTLAERIRDLRVRAQLTQAELAERARVSERTISDIERGLRQGVYSVTARRLAEALDLPDSERAAFEASARGRHATRPAVAMWTSGLEAMRRTRLVGRERELETLSAALASDDVRLVTITGLGGIGKSRLAAEACAALERDEPGHVFVVLLAALRDPGLVLPTIARSLGIAEAGTGVLDDLAHYWTGRRALLVLDTFEPVIEAATSVGELIDRVSDLTVLVTSRAPLRLRGEREFPVGPLPVRPRDSPGVDRFPAEALFEERALAARPGLVMDEASQDIVAEVCRRLSGIPLALELAAARVRHMSLAALQAQLDDPLRLLTGGERDLPERQQTMSATIAWSHDLLWPEERIVFRRLSCFAGGWTLAAAEGVCLDEQLARSRVLEALARLAEQGLVVPDDYESAQRWRMLDPIWHFAAQCLAEAGEQELVRRRHAEFFAELAERAEPEIRAGAQSTWRRVLRPDFDNVRTALQWAFESGDAEVALRLVAGMWMFWRMEGAFGEGSSWLERALAMDAPVGSPHRLRAMWGAAWLVYQRGDYERAIALGNQLEALSRECGQPLDRRNALTILGHVATARGRAAEAVAPLQEAVDISRAEGARWHLATSLLNLGTALLHCGEVARAEDLLHQAVAGFEAQGDRHFVARTIIQLGYLSIVAGDFDRAAARFGEAMQAFLDLDEMWGMADVLEGSAAAAAGRGDAERAAVLSGAALSAFATISTSSLGPDLAISRPLLEQARASLGDASWESAVNRGRSMSLEAATRFAQGT